MSCRACRLASPLPVNQRSVRRGTKPASLRPVGKRIPSLVIQSEAMGRIRSIPSESPLMDLSQSIRRLVLTAVSEPVEWIGKTGQYTDVLVREVTSPRSDRPSLDSLPQ